tara:strand:- start:41 stop:733 length:693 start_codon:yes stop_codon:yes gene_type:complete
MSTETTRWLGWHWVGRKQKLRDGQIVEVGMTHPAIGDIRMCQRGYHASNRAIDALGYGSNSAVIACRVELLGDRIDEHDKSVGSQRRVIAIIDAEMILHEFACWCADQALKLIDKPDPRSIKAIQVKRKWIKGKADRCELAAARAAAWDAAWDAAGTAAGDAAGTAARAAAWDAAGGAAGTAAGTAARAAAGDAAGTAAGDAARAAAWDAAWTAQNKKLESMLLEAIDSK